MFGLHSPCLGSLRRNKFPVLEKILNSIHKNTAEEFTISVPKIKIFPFALIFLVDYLKNLFHANKVKGKAGTVETIALI